MSGVRTITGMATTNAVDRAGDVIDPKGATYKVPFPLLLQHDHNKPIGTVTSIQRLGNGLLATATLVPPGVSADADMAWGLIQAKALSGLSIGFRPVSLSEGKAGLNYDETEIFELSVVSVPCNSDCMIVHFDAQAKSVKQKLESPKLPDAGTKARVALKPFFNPHRSNV